MLMSRLKTRGMLALVVSVIGAGAIVINDRACADENTGEELNKERLITLLKERRAFVNRQFDSCKKKAFRLKKQATEGNSVAPELRDIYSPGTGAAMRRTDPLYLATAQDRLYLWAQRLLTAELELSKKKADRVAAHEAHLRRMKEAEDVFKKGVEKDEADPYAAEATFHRMNAEIMLARAKAS